MTTDGELRTGKDAAVPIQRYCFGLNRLKKKQIVTINSSPVEISGRQHLNTSSERYHYTNLLGVQNVGTKSI
jgi:hypothetical protein